MIKHILKLLWNKKKSNSLIMIEIFLSFLVLFAVISYVLFNFDKLQKPLGFETENKLLILFDDMKSKDSTLVAENLPILKAALETFPEVKKVGYSSFITPFSGSMWRNGYDKDGQGVNFRVAEADEDFMEAIDLNMSAGKWFEEGSENLDFKPILVSRYFADTYYNGDSILGVIIPNINNGSKVIGIFEDYKYKGEFDEGEGIIFNYLNPKSKEVSSAIVNLNEPITPLLEKKISEEIKLSFKGMSFIIQDLEKRREESSRSTWVSISALTIVSLFLCLNVALGLFGVLWYTIQKRRGEIGLRRAMGATSGQINLQFIVEIIFLALVSILVGIFFSIQVPLLKVIDVEPFIFFKAILYSTLIVLIVVILCALYPSRQASLLSPASVLHED